MKRTLGHKLLLVFGVASVALSSMGLFCEKGTAADNDTVLASICDETDFVGIDTIRTTVGFAFNPGIAVFTESTCGTGRKLGVKMSVQSSNPAVVRASAATVDVGSESFTAVGVGEATLTSRVASAKTAGNAPLVWTRRIRVVAGTGPRTIRIDPSPSVTLAPGASTELTGTVLTDQGEAINTYRVDWGCINSTAIRIVTCGSTTEGVNKVLSKLAVTGSTTGLMTFPVTLRTRGNGSLSPSDPGASVRQDVTIRVGTREFRITPTTGTAAAGGAVQFTLGEANPDGSTTPVPAGQATWTISPASSVASIDATGRATCTAGGSGGSVTVRATYTGPGAATAPTIPAATLTCTAPVLPTLRVTPASATAAAGASVTFTLNEVNNANQNVPIGTAFAEWAIAPSSVATINRFTGVATCAATGAGGTATVTGTYLSTQQTATTQLACAAPAITSVSVSPSATQVQVGQTVTLTATVLNATGAIDMSWSPATSAFVTVVKTGPATATVTGVSPTPPNAPATVTATYVQGGTSYTATSAITVVPATAAAGYSVASRTVSVVQGAPTTTAPTPVTLGVTRTGGFTGALGVVVSGAPAGLTVLPASTSFTGDVTLNITAATVAPGSYPITVRTIAAGLPDQTTTLTVTVTAPATSNAVARIVLEEKNAEITAPAALPYRVRFYNAAGNPTVSDGGTLTYTSSVPTVATIDLAGTFAFATGRSAGTTTITATYARAGQPSLTDASTLLVYASTSPAEHVGAVEISAPNDTRQLQVGQEISVNVVVRDRNGIQILTRRDDLTLTAEGPNAAALEITRDASVTSGYVFRIRAKAAVPLPGVEVRADLTGAAGSIFLVVTP